MDINRKLLFSPTFSPPLFSIPSRTSSIDDLQPNQPNVTNVKNILTPPNERESNSKNISNEKKSEVVEDDLLKQKRERNSAASARARIKKKKKVEELEKTNADLTKFCDTLVRENEEAKARIKLLENKLREFEVAFSLASKIQDYHPPPFPSSNDSKENNSNSNSNNSIEPNPVKSCCSSKRTLSSNSDSQLLI